MTCGWVVSIPNISSGPGEFEDSNLVEGNQNSRRFEGACRRPPLLPRTHTEVLLRSPRYEISINDPDNMKRQVHVLIVSRSSRPVTCGPTLPLVNPRVGDEKLRLRPTLVSKAEHQDTNAVNIK